MWKLKGLERGAEPYLEVQEEYSLVLKVGRQDHSQGAWESIGLYEVEELGGLERGRSPLPWLQEVQEPSRGAGENSPL